MRAQAFAIAITAVTALAATGCDELDLQGQLGNGEFQYQCGGPGDAACDGTYTILGFDLDRDVLPVAVGANFGMSFDDEDATVVPASEAMVSVNGTTLRYQTAAAVDFLAMSKKGEVIDFAPLTGEEPTALHIYYDGTAVSSISESAYRDIEIAAAPVAGGQVLGGGLTYSWTVQGDNVTLVDGGSDNVAIVNLSSSGAGGSVTATAAGMSATVSFH